MAIILLMSDEKPKPVDDLKEGLGLLFRAAKGAVEMLPTVVPNDAADKVEVVAKDAVKEISRALETLGSEVEKLINYKPTQAAPPPEPPKDETKYDDGYAPEPPKGPRVG